MGIQELDVLETSDDGTRLTFLSLTKPYAAVKSPIYCAKYSADACLQSAGTQSLLKLRFVSLTIPETNAKESRVKVTLTGVTYTFHPNLQWITDLKQCIRKEEACERDQVLLVRDV